MQGATLSIDEVGCQLAVVEAIEKLFDGSLEAPQAQVVVSGAGAESFAILRHMSLNLFKQERFTKTCMNIKQQNAVEHGVP
ncbi:hypothetical protein HNP55_002658 [Paucibacter oligotrophus]|uniref:Uncharacterized protein n=1 Tax=Roseateles oligotrophus TaxID=1769250 RepID=A0A840LBU0_9BURK|nr:hypothetical protein [Roseateles oligotrophus]MBB4844122.1 hypothetical protein [Roseateles oligotrophus]